MSNEDNTQTTLAEAAGDKLPLLDSRASLGHLKKEEFDLFSRVLLHYSAKAKKATEADDKGNFLAGKEFFDKDIQSLDKEIESILKELKSLDLNDWKRVGSDAKYDELLIRAFSLYVTDLEAARKEFLKKFGADAEKPELDLKNLDDEIKFAKSYFPRRVSLPC